MHVHKFPIVLEGPDGGGKSTLADFLSEETRIPVFHTGGPPISDAANALQILRGLEASSRHILDRFSPICELVYPRVFGADPFLPEAFLYKLCVTFSPVVIYCRSNEDLMRTSFEAAQEKKHKPREHIDRVRETYPLLVRRYDEVMSCVRLTSPVFHFDRAEDVRGRESEKALSFVRSFLQMDQ